MILTLPHYGIMILFLLLFFLIAFLLKDEEKTTLIVTLAVSAVLLIGLTVGSCYGIDSVIKKVELSHVETHRLISQEKLIISGFVNNKGSYPVGSCSLKTTISHTPDLMELGALKNQLDSQFGTQDSFLAKLKAFISGETIVRGERLQTSYVFDNTVTGRLEAGESEEFSISVSIPSGVQNPKYMYDLSCH